MTLSALFDLLAFMLPAYAANMAPPFLRFWKGWNPPLSRRLFGSHKTVLGSLAGVAAAVATAFFQSLAGGTGFVSAQDHWLSLGLLMGIGAVGGDAVKSFFKRRLGIAPGKPWIPFDQLDFQIGALLLAGHRAPIGAADITLILLLGLIGHVTVNRIAWRLGIKDTKW